MKKNYSLLIFLIKSSRIIVYILAAVGLAAYFLFTDVIPLFQKFFALILVYIFIIFLYLLIFLFMKNQYKMINDVLFSSCDPFGYIDIYRRIIDKLAKTKKLAALDYYRLNLSAGLIAAGRYDEAYLTLGDLKSFKNNRVGKLSDTVRYNNLCSVCLKLGRTDEAKYYLDCLVGCVAALSPRYHQKYLKYVDLARYGLNIAKGVYDNAENFYNEVFNKATSNYERVNAKFVLGKVFLHYGDAARAKEAFKYVIEHGNKLFIAEEAKEQLAQTSVQPAGEILLKLKNN